MRGALLIGLAVVLLIIGVLVMKNVGGNSPNSVQETQAEESMEKAKNAAEDVNKRLQDLKKQTHEAE